MFWCFKSRSQTYDPLPTYEEVVITSYKKISKVDIGTQTTFEDETQTPKKSEHVNLLNEMSDLTKKHRLLTHQEKIHNVFKIFDLSIQILNMEFYGPMCNTGLEKAKEFMNDKDITDQQREKFKKYKKNFEIIKFENFFKNRPDRYNKQRPVKKINHTLYELQHLLNTIDKKRDRYKSICEIFDMFVEILLEIPNLKFQKYFDIMIEKADEFLKTDDHTEQQKEQFQKYKKQIISIKKLIK